MQTSTRNAPNPSRQRWARGSYDNGDSACAAVVFLVIYAADFKGHLVGEVGVSTLGEQLG